MITKRCTKIRGAGMAGVMLVGGTFNYLESVEDPLKGPSYDLAGITMTSSAVATGYAGQIDDQVTGAQHEVPAARQRHLLGLRTDPTSGGA